MSTWKYASENGQVLNQGRWGTRKYREGYASLAGGHWRPRVRVQGTEHDSSEGPLDIVLFLLIWEVKHIKSKCDYT